MAIFSTSINCPVDHVKVNENQVRVTAYQVMYIAIAWIFFQVWPIFLFLSIDFLLRAINLGKYSLLNRISELVIHKLGIGNKPVDRAPKRFAAGVGLVFSLAIVAAELFAVSWLALLLAATITLFAFLEAVLGFCAGCYVYHFINQLRYPNYLKLKRKKQPFTKYEKSTKLVG